MLAAASPAQAPENPVFRARGAGADELAPVAAKRHCACAGVSVRQGLPLVGNVSLRSGFLKAGRCMRATPRISMQINRHRRQAITSRRHETVCPPQATESARASRLSP
jgi:hypothetical protein